MTTIAPPPPSAASPARPRPGDEMRVATVVANLLPDEVVLARRLRSLQRTIVLALAVVVAVVVTLYGLSWLQTESARGDLNDAQKKTTTLQQQLQQYQPLLDAQSKAASINATLRTLMANDLSWRTLIGRIQGQAGSAAAITGFTGNVADPTAGAAAPAAGQNSGLPLLNESGKSVVGTLTITGTARDNKSLATFVEKLGTVKGLTAPLPTSVTSDHGPLTWTITALVTSDALGGRWSAPATGATGPGTTTGTGTTKGSN